MIDVTKVLKALAPDAAWALDGSEIIWEESVERPGELIPKNLTWYSRKIPVPKKYQIDAKTIELQAVEDSIAYQKLRKPEYPPLADFVDAMYWQTKGDNTKMTAYIAAVDAVKEKYPKE
jgi:hypothetical protein